MSFRIAWKDIKKMVTGAAVNAGNEEQLSAVRTGTRRLHTISLLGKCILFLLILCVVWRSIDQTLIYKQNWANSSTPSTSSYSGFYAMEENTVDVLLMGSSHMGCGINPQDIYDAAGIRSYNLASNAQQLSQTWFWLQEALQYQSPRVVVLDTLCLYSDMYYEESVSRNAFNSMRIGSVKLEAVNTLTAMSENNGSTLSYFLTNIRYHARWAEPEEADFLWMRSDAGTQAKGYYRPWGVCGDDAFVPLTSSECEAAEPESFYELSLEYMDKIVGLCEAEGIELVLIKTPDPTITAGHHRAIQNYADEHGLTFYDFNTEELYNEIGFNYAGDMFDSADNAHANPSGARKMSVYLANALLGVNGLESVMDDQYESSREFNEHCWQNFSLICEVNLLPYLTYLDQDRYSIIISAKDDASSSLTDEIVEAMKALGFDFDLKDRYRFSYIAIRSDGEITELLSEEKVEIQGALDGGSLPLIVTSAGTNTGNVSSVLIAGEEYSVNNRGLNFVVYDNEIHCVIDSVCFDTYDSAQTASR